MDMCCPKCTLRNIKLNGKYKSYQKYKCKDCNRQFSQRSFSFFARHRYPEEVIINGILFFLFVSTRNVVFLLKETIGFRPSNVSVYNWAKKFAQVLCKRKTTKAFSNIWHLDEKFIKVKKSIDDFAYEWVVMDDKNSMIAVHVSDKRDINGARKILEIAKRQAEKPPDIMVTDGLNAYLKACKKVFGRKTKHVRAHFEPERFMHKGRYFILSNNRIESLNSKINLWYKKFRGFKSLETANLWCKMWMYFYNLMRPRVTCHKTISIHQIIH